jgi:ketosteroid isomerase-like protein
MASGSEAIVRQFIACINSHDVKKIVALCTADHAFIDSLGSKMSGLEDLQQGWGWYFAMFPDYRIEIESAISSGDLTLACGFAAATHGPSGIRWRIPAAWRARVANAQIAEWQVYADNKPVYELLSRPV